MLLHIEITLDDGTAVLTTFDDQPLRLRPGDGTLASGLENLIAELPTGDEHRIGVTGAMLFGDPDPALIRRLPASDLPNDMAFEIGDVIAFTTPSGEQAVGTLLEWADDGALVDFNHPLIQRDLKLRVLILEKD